MKTTKQMQHFAGRIRRLGFSRPDFYLANRTLVTQSRAPYFQEQCTFLRSQAGTRGLLLAWYASEDDVVPRVLKTIRRSLLSSTSPVFQPQEPIPLAASNEVIIWKQWSDFRQYLQDHLGEFRAAPILLVTDISTAVNSSIQRQTELLLQQQLALRTIPMVLSYHTAANTASTDKGQASLNPQSLPLPVPHHVTNALALAQRMGCDRIVVVASAVATIQVAKSLLQQLTAHEQEVPQLIIIPTTLTATLFSTMTLRMDTNQQSCSNVVLFDVAENHWVPAASIMPTSHVHPTGLRPRVAVVLPQPQWMTVPAKKRRNVEDTTPPLISSKPKTAPLSILVGMYASLAVALDVLVVMAASPRPDSTVSAQERIAVRVVHDFVAFVRQVQHDPGEKDALATVLDTMSRAGGLLSSDCIPWTVAMSLVPSIFDQRLVEHNFSATEFPVEDDLVLAAAMANTVPALYEELLERSRTNTLPTDIQVQVIQELSTVADFLDESSIPRRLVSTEPVETLLQQVQTHDILRGHRKPLRNRHHKILSVFALA
jgi:hypothetical protein